MANFTRLRSVLSPCFLPISSFVNTAESLISLPAAAMVRTTPTGRLLVSGTFCVQISQSEVSGFAVPWAMPFAVSIELPPPTARIKSAPKEAAAFTPASAKERSGFGLTPPHSLNMIPASSSSTSILSSSPLLFTLPPP